MENKTYHYKVILKDNSSFDFNVDETEPFVYLKNLTEAKFYVFGDGVCINTDYIKYIEFSEV